MINVQFQQMANLNWLGLMEPFLFAFASHLELKNSAFSQAMILHYSGVASVPTSPSLSRASNPFSACDLPPRLQ